MDHLSNITKRTSGFSMGNEKGKIVTAKEAAEIIKDGDVVGWGGFGGIGFAEEIAAGIEKRFIETGHPKKLTLYYTSGLGDGKNRGLNRLAHEGLIKRVIAGHYGFTPKLARLALENKIEAYNLPQGCLAQMLRDAGAHKPRTITSVGVGTFVDPRLEGGKVNSITKEDIVELMELDGKEYLAYKPQPLDVAVIRGTTADANGNITMEKEALTLEVLSMAIAAKNNGGFVIAQVERIAKTGSLSPREVKIPGIMADCIVVASDPLNHMQTYGTLYDPSFAGEFPVPVSELEPFTLDARKVIARRAAFELIPNCVVNLGVGMAEGVAAVAAEEGILDLITLTAEPGVIGGIPAGGFDFGAARNADSIIDQPYQFDFYDGGGMDIAFLGLAQADQHGNLNVSKFGPKLAGCGGFINISQNSKKVVFVGTFTAAGLEVLVGDGKVNIENEGKLKKFIDQVEQITFSGKVAADSNQPVLFITERCVLELTKKGLVLKEVAPGVDIEKDIVSQMEFKPIIDETPIPMDDRIFSDSPMGLRREMLNVPIENRITYDEEQNTFFANFEYLTIRKPEDISAIETYAHKILEPLNKRVKTIINYDNFDILPELIDEYMDMVKQLGDRYYDSVTRYTTSTFMRMKLGDSLKERGMPPHIYDCMVKAGAALKRG